MIKISRQGAGLSIMLAKVSRLESKAKTEAVGIVADEVRKLVVASASAGQTPDGKAWAAKKAGGRPLAAAGRQVSVSVQGTSAVVKIPSPLGYHQTGTSRGLPAREIIPTKLPQRWRTQISKALRRWFQGSR